MAAIHAAARGEVVLIDSAVLPRDKSCGGMLNEHAQEFLAEYGRVPRSVVSDPAWVNFRYHDWDRAIKKPTELRFANVDRRLFDDWLLSLLPSNVVVFSGTALKSVAQDETSVTAVLQRAGAPTHTIRCENLIGCDGPRSTVRRALGAQHVATYVTLQDYCEHPGGLEPFFDCVYLRGIGDSFAYAYVVPKGNTAIVGSVFYPGTKHPHVKHDQALNTLRGALPLGTSIKREAWVALCVRQSRDMMSGAGRILLAGEAGGFMSPTSGEGISYALNTGRLAGLSVSSSDPLKALGSYRSATARIASNISRKLKWLPFMESRAGKYFAGHVPAAIISTVTKGL